ncbi:MAG TPA: glycosyltransferase [Chitinophagales bacterium]
MAKKIICCVTNDLTTDQRMLRICSTLADAGYSVTLVGRKLKNSAPLAERNFAQKRLNCVFTKGKLFYIEYNLRLLIWLLFQKADAVCAIDLDTIVPSYFSAKLKNQKLIYDAHEYFPFVPEVIDRPFTHKIWLWVEKTFLPKADLIYTVSNSIAKQFEKQYKKTVFLIRNIPFKKELEIVEKTEKILLYQGAVNEGRGLEQLLLAMRQIPHKLYIFGDGDVKQKLEQLVEKYDLQMRVIFKGKVSPEVLWQETTKAYIGINLLENKGLSYWFSLPNKLFDYIQAGIPQLIMNFPDQVALNDQKPFGIALENLEEETIIHAINELLNNSELYAKLQNNCVALAAELTWENESKTLLSLYEKLFR